MADDTAGFAPVFAGWNVWNVAQRRDLSFDPLMIGVDRDRRLRSGSRTQCVSAPAARRSRIRWR
jgi:hypothetical protein